MLKVSNFHKNSFAIFSFEIQLKWTHSLLLSVVHGYPDTFMGQLFWKYIKNLFIIAEWKHTWNIFKFFFENIQRTENRGKWMMIFFMSQYVYFPYILFTIVPIINYLNNTDKEKRNSKILYSHFVTVLHDFDPLYFPHFPF